MAQETDFPTAHIIAPEPDAPLQGQISITGYTAIADLQGWLLEFGYADDPTNTWFLISESDQAIEDGALAEWDTTTITDGNYNLRLTVRAGESRQVEHIIPVRVRNYTPIETATPQPTQPATAVTPGGQPVETATSDVHPTLTPLPTNPAELTVQDVAESSKTGVLVVVAISFLLGAYLYVRRLARR